MLMSAKDWSAMAEMFAYEPYSAMFYCGLNRPG